MRIVIPGGSGQVGQVLARGLRARGHTVQIIGRSVADPALRWDGRTPGPWCEAIDGADAVISLAGRSVSCRYHWANLNEMFASRVDSALAVGDAIARAARPPKVWIQASTASIYRHSTHTPAVDGGPLGRTDSATVAGTPDYWAYSMHIARAWELALAAVPTPHTRKVALRLGFTMSPDPGGIFDWLMWLVRWGLGGPFVGGEQYVGWIGDRDLVRAVCFLIERDDLAGPVNLTAPTPLPNRAFMATLRRAAGVSWGLPIARWMARIGAVFLDTDIELMEKSRRVLPQRLLDAGFVFEQPTWEQAAPDLHDRWARAESYARSNSPRTTGSPSRTIQAPPAST